VIDLTQFPPGTFGRLRPLRRTGERRGTSLVWECLCDPALGGCGAVVAVSAAQLRKPPGRGTRSCGCLPRGRRSAQGVWW
jgi:hypothetical protein